MEPFEGDGKKEGDDSPQSVDAHGERRQTNGPTQQQIEYGQHWITTLAIRFATIFMVLNIWRVHFISYSLIFAIFEIDFSMPSTRVKSS
ncbi:hypothetical protein IAD21_01927 [Abditibacteriota bacterium]|nr:hypothetical protein IAD21_01927 [Abditibacteriota bacterium]